MTLGKLQNLPQLQFSFPKVENGRVNILFTCRFVLRPNIRSGTG